MEKILRKVKYLDKKPEKAGYYYTDCGEAKYDGTTELFYSVNKIIVSNQPDIVHHIKIFPEYWYEEVDIDEMLRDATCNMKELFSMSKLFAKERYEKGLESIPENYGLRYTSGFTLDEWNIIKKALKIAAGIEEK